MTQLEKIDRRKVRTRQLLREALIALVGERGYDNISIQDITERANVNRSTFYLHYKDKDELLFNSMRDLYDDIVRTFYHGKNYFQDAEQGNYPHVVDYQHVAKFADFYRVMLSEKGSAGFIMRALEYLQTIAQQEMAQSLAEINLESTIPMDFTAAYCAGGQIGLIRWWVMRGMPETPEALARMQYNLFWNGMAGAVRPVGAT